MLVVGAGSAGAVLAARLSEDPRRSVLLLEAGRDFPDLKTMPADLNHPDTATGVGPRPINNVGGLRLSTAVTDLHQARGRPNLTIRADVLVRRVLVRGSGLSAWRPSAGRGIIAFFSVPDGISLELYQAPAPQASRPTAQCRHRGIHRSGTAPRQMDERGLEIVSFSDREKQGHRVKSGVAGRQHHSILRTNSAKSLDPPRSPLVCSMVSRDSDGPDSTLKLPTN